MKLLLVIYHEIFRFGRRRFLRNRPKKHSGAFARRTRIILENKFLHDEVVELSQELDQYILVIQSIQGGNL
ncbi:aspartyl-phosphate phosphatase Spo0E family protein [Brevibacillus parabrevis]